MTSRPTQPHGGPRGVQRLVLSGLSTLTVVVLLFGYRTSTAGPLEAAAGSRVVTAGSTPGGTSGASADTAPDTGGSSGGSSGASSGGHGGSQTVTGDQVQTEWGPVQVALTVADGQITEVAVPVYPNGNPRDVEINSYALPILVQSTLDAQSADIDMVSGATVTSQGYLSSLQSALDQADL